MTSMTVSAIITLEAPQRNGENPGVSECERGGETGSVSAVMTAGKWSVAEDDRLIGPLAEGDRMMGQLWNLGQRAQGRGLDSREENLTFHRA